ncbi:MoxR family ATPase [Nostoc spongiaeforme FACHB-130]|uniref:MoxR family ATPase n=1 Tax=Nostoc spongiaeforme FACHB-130 TaxID=1357510 RepID=A0ABR8FNG7_9NOSO|nr:MoxR family ATPase [Nostoc spongiaeforme]MBD2592836.1 MoxR family ATPase [Nostoc spongiaeforme FACHB-130]
MAKALNKRMKYTGEVQPQPGEQDPQTGQLLYPYLPSPKLVEAVNLAIALERPLLLKGEPGCGKTKLARAVAYELGLPYEAWYIKSTSRAKDGLYTYDAVGRLRDAQLAAAKIDAEATSKAKDADAYVEWGALGRAFNNEQKTVLLIDEIDKADIDFPNDLLLELDEKRFEVTEVKQNSPIKQIQAKATPIVFITSNDEKDLPDAFLRRCLFHYVKFPEREQLIKIVKAHFPVSTVEVLDTIIDRFLELREEMRRDKGEVGKKVSTSELMDWVRILSHHPDDEILTKLKTELLYPGVLLKSWDDYRRYGEQSVLNSGA